MEQDWSVREMSDATIRDPRRVKSLVRICASLAARPGLSFSAACGPALRQAAHRLFEHQQTTAAKLLHGHVQQTAARCSDYPLVIAIQDTTTLEYAGLKATVGLGPINDAETARGLFAHTVFAVAPDGMPLGLLGLQQWVRDPKTQGKTRDRRKKPPEEKESHKWRLGLQAVEAALPAQQPVLLIQDREGDVFDFLAAPRGPNTQLLVRASQPRVVELPVAAGEAAGPRGTLFDFAASAPVVASTTARLGRKTRQPAREARLEVRATALMVRPPARRGVPQVPQRLWVVQARESEPPEGEEAVEWVLLTTMELPDAKTACQAVGYYALRWGIERLHFTVKSGCQAERLQFDDATSIQHALALYFVVAWRLLYLTHLARTEPERPAHDLLATEELAVLTQAEGKPVTTAQAAVRAVAKLGGHETYRNAPEPGVKRLWLGLRRLEAMVEGWRLARAMLYPRHDL
jgi:hypothetical protein